MTISMKNQYRTRDGQPVRILCTDRADVYSVVGMVNDSMLCIWQSNGMYDHSAHPFDLIEVTIYDDFKIDDKVMVSNSKGSFVRRYFAGVSTNGSPLAFRDGRTSWNSAGFVDVWRECRKPTEEELCAVNNEE